MNLYRYISFEAFVDIVQSNHLTFVSPLISWEDTYEGSVFRTAKNEKGRELLRKIAFDNNVTDFADLLQNDIATSVIKCLCWCAKPDSVPMWSIYSYGERAIMIETNDKKIENLKHGDQNIKLLKVDYTNAELKRQLLGAVNKNDEGQPEIDFSKLFVCKRKDFQHEHEYRAFAGLQANEFDSTTYRLPIHVKIDIGAKEFISNVIVHPLAPSWYVEAVKKYCDLNEIKCSGKSKLYDFELDKG